MNPERFCEIIIASTIDYVVVLSQSSSFKRIVPV